MNLQGAPLFVYCKVDSLSAYFEASFLEKPMDRALKKLAKQLNSYDEASLMALWGDYARRVQAFEPTQEWEESALVFCMIQAANWKNQLFNFHMAANYLPGSKDNAPSFMPFPSSEKGEGFDDVEGQNSTGALGEGATPGHKKKGMRLRFPSK